jgi:chromosomal replication initiation ATPase DnaA
MISPYIFPGLPYLRRFELLQQGWESDFDLIWDVVCKHTGIKPEQRSNTRRKRELVFARYIAMYFMAMRPVAGISKSAYYRAIAAYFGKDRATMMHGLKVLANMLEVYGEKWEYTPAIKAIADELSFIWETRHYYVQRAES